jgi:hypothetical protein
MRLHKKLRIGQKKKPELEASKVVYLVLLAILTSSCVLYPMVGLDTGGECLEGGVGPERVEPGWEGRGEWEYSLPVSSLLRQI